MKRMSVVRQRIDNLQVFKVVIFTGPGNSGGRGLGKGDHSNIEYKIFSIYENCLF